MIGHYLLALSDEQGDRVLVSHMTAFRKLGGPCLVMTTGKSGVHGDDVAAGRPQTCHQYDAAVFRFGAPRVNAAIRNRILANRLWRTLENRPVTCGAFSPPQRKDP